VSDHRSQWIEVFIMSGIQVSPQAQAAETPSTPKLGWTLDELARSLSVSVPFLRLEVKRGRLRAAHLGRRVVVLDTEVRRYLTEANAPTVVRRY
jgi:excisionase family DNA binding protein